MTSFASTNANHADPYKVLQLPRNATTEQIRRAYKKACLRHHPDKHPAGPARLDAERTFKHITAAYSKLTDTHRINLAPKPTTHPQARTSPSVPHTPSAQTHSTHTSFRETPSSRTSTPPSSSQRSHSYAHFDHDDTFTHHAFRPKDREVDLPLTLEEFASGCVKRRKVRAAAVADSLLPTLTISIKPGYRPGDRVRFRSAWTPPGASAPSDVVFVLSQKRHTTFVLDGDDLHLTMRLNLVDALTGALLVVHTLDSSPLNLLLDPVISPKHVERVKARGMPCRSDPNKRGDLLVSFDIVFPTDVDAEHRTPLRDLFAKFDKDDRTKRQIRRSSSLFVNPQQMASNLRRASTTDPTNSSVSRAHLKKDRRHDAMDTSPPPQSKTRRRLAAIFR